MKKKLFFVGLALVFFFTFTMSNARVFADENGTAMDEPIKQNEQIMAKEVRNTKNESDEAVANDNENIEDIDEASEEDELKEDELNASKEKKEKEKKRIEKELKNEVKQTWKEEKNKLEMQKDELEAKKDAIEAQKDELELQLEAAEESGDKELAGQLEESIGGLKEEMNEIKQQMKQCKIQIREKIRSSYNEEEINELEEAASKIKEKYKDLKVLPFDSVIAKGKSIKFDTPPVIKDGRTLIPVRAISEVFGAQVTWNAEEHKVTVIKGDKEIVLEIGSNVVYINGVETQIDTSAEVLNGRTVVPLRFIIESMGLKVDWDSETETIGVEEQEDSELTEADEEADDNVKSEEEQLAEEAPVAKD